MNISHFRLLSGLVIAALLAALMVPNHYPGTRSPAAQAELSLPGPGQWVVLPKLEREIRKRSVRVAGDAPETLDCICTVKHPVAAHYLRFEGKSETPTLLRHLASGSSSQRSPPQLV